MSEGGRDIQFEPSPPDEHEQRSPVDERYDAIVPAKAKGLFSEAGIGTDVKGILKHSMDVQPTETGEWPEGEKAFFDLALAEMYEKIDDSALLDDVRKSQVRDALNTFIANTDVEGGSSLDHALGYADPLVAAESADEEDVAKKSEDRARDILKGVGIGENDHRFEALLNELRDLPHVKELNESQIESLQQGWIEMGIRKSEAEALLAQSGLSDEQRKEVLKGIPEKTDDEMLHEEKIQGSADEAMTELQREQKTAEELLEELPDGEEKENLRARLARWNLWLEENNIKKVGRGLGKLTFMVALAFLVVIIWELQMVNKASKKK